LPRALSIYPSKRSDASGKSEPIDAAPVKFDPQRHDRHSRRHARPELDEITVERMVVGLFFAGVKLSSGSIGSCATPIKTIPEAVKRSVSRSIPTRSATVASFRSIFRGSRG
jgi:hypothetical protein